MRNVALLIFLLINVQSTFAHPTLSAPCHGHWVNPAMDIDWNGFFPITIGSSPVVSGHLPDTKNPSNPVCTCPGNPFPHIGLSTGYWEPIAVLDVTRTPYCLVNLGGQKLETNSTSEGMVATESPDQNSSFYEVHYYNFPIMSWIAPELLGGSCQTDGAFFEPSYFSELDPTWHDEALAEIAFPETKVFSNPVTAISAQLACGLDSLAANTGLPSDTAFWCAGSQGFMFPMTGTVAEHVGGVQASTLLSERMVFKLHQLGLITDTRPENLCSEVWDYNLHKSRYAIK